MKTNWILYATLALIIFSVLSFCITLLTRKGHSVATVLFGVGFFFTVFLFIQSFLISHEVAMPSLKLIGIFAILGLLSALANYLQFQAANDAPNAGLAIAISGQQAILIAILAGIFLKDKINSLQVVGIILAAAAIALINFGSTKTTAIKPQAEQSTTRQE